VAYTINCNEAQVRSATILFAVESRSRLKYGEK